MKKIIFRLVTSIITTIMGVNSAAAADSSQVVGSFKTEYTAEICLFYNDDANNLINCSKIEKGKFSFNLSVDSPILANVYIKGVKSTIAKFYVTTGRVYLECDVSLIHLKSGDTLYNLSIETVRGSEYEDIKTKFYSQLRSISSPEDTDSVSREKSYKRLYIFAKHNSDHRLTPFLISNADLNLTQNTALLPLLKPTVLRSYEGKLLIKMIRTQQASRNSAVGSTFNDFDLEDLGGNVVNTSTLTSKRLMINVWASWCIPCRKEHDELTHLYKRFKKDGFQIISISLDTKAGRSSWKKAIKQDRLSWPQLRSRDSTISLYYGIESIPYNLLLDNNRKIVAKNLSVEDLTKHLTNHFRKSRTH